MRSQRGLRLAATLGQSENLGKTQQNCETSQVLKKVHETTAVEREDQPFVGFPAGQPIPAYALRTSRVRTAYVRRNLSVRLASPVTNLLNQ